jgi:hypothetical protein
MDYCLGRRNKDGMLEGLPGDWVFLDWAPMKKDGALSAIQILFARSLEAISLCAGIMHDSQSASHYQQLSKDLQSKVVKTFWDPEKKAFIQGIKDGQINPQVTRYANMFALMFNYLDSTKASEVKNNVLLNDSVQKITTPYMRFYELEALAMIGQLDYVTHEMKNYWGGMLKEGATSFWEYYDPGEKGAARYAMYGRPYGKSLCHAWGASPVYLIGKYYLGVSPLQPGYEQYSIHPNLGGLEWMEGKVPTPKGDIAVSINLKQLTVRTAGGKGVLQLESAREPSTDKGTVVHKGGIQYELVLEPHTEYHISYTAVSGTNTALNSGKVYGR